MTTHIDFEALELQIDALAASFAGARPFPHVAIENFLRPDSLTRLLEAIQPPDIANRSNDYFFAKNKFETPTFASSADILNEVRNELLSDRFERALSKIYGQEVFIDPQFVGGGIHQGGAGSYLDMHADFNRHPANAEWLRELNLLLYLNPGYDDSFGGHLELEHAKSGEWTRVAPQLNRMVIMLTKEFTLHGYKPISFPPGTYRTALASYAYSIDNNLAATPQRSTQWVPQGGPAYKRLFARVAPGLVGLKNRLLGSNTVRRATRNDGSDQG